MRLLKVELRNFLSHQDTVLPLDERGVTVIVGPNGAGKSSIFKGILFGLFGEGQPKSLRRRGSTGGFGVRLEFKVGSNLYQLSRQYASRRGDVVPDERGVYLLKNGAAVAAGRVKDLNAAVRRELGGGKEVFTLSVMALQGRVGGIFEEEPPSRRKELLEKVLGFHMAKLVAEAAVLLKRRYEDGLKERLTQVGVSDIREAEEVLKKAQEEERQARQRIQELTEELEGIKRLLQEAEERLREARNRDRRRQQLRGQLGSLEERLRSLGQEIRSGEEKLKALPTLSEELRRLSEEVRALGPLRQEILIINEIEHLRKTEELLEKRLREAARAAEAVESLKGAEEEEAKLEAKLRQVQERRQELKRQLGKVESKEEELAKLRRAWAETKKALERAEARLPEGLKTQEQVREAELKLRERMEEVKKALGELEGREKEMLSRKEELSKAHGKCPLCGQELTPQHLERILAETEGELARIEELKAQLRREEEELGARLGALARAARSAAEAEIYRARLQELESRGKELAQSLNVKGELLKSAGEAEREERELRSALEALKPKIQELARNRGILKEIEAERPGEELEKTRGQRQKLEEKRAFPSLSKEELLQRVALLEAKEARMRELEQQVAALSALVQELERKRKELAQAEKERESILKELEKLGPEEDLEALQREVDALRAKRENIRSQLAKFEERAERLRERVEEAETHLKRLKRISWKLSVAKDLTEALQGKWLDRRFGEAFENLNRRFGEIFARFGFDGEARIDLDEVKPYIKRGTFSVSSLSGGEMVAAGLALRLAIASRFGLECLFLDEPTVYMDDERVHGLAELVDALRSSPRAPQIVIITHDDQLFHPIADRVVRIRKRGGVSVVEADV